MDEQKAATEEEGLMTIRFIQLNTRTPEGFPGKALIRVDRIAYITTGLEIDPSGAYSDKPDGTDIVLVDRMGAIRVREDFGEVVSLLATGVPK